MRKIEFQTQTCKTCVYYSQYKDSFQKHGECRINPPTTHQFGDGDDVTTVFPEVEETHYCGQWEHPTLIPLVKCIRDNENRTHWNHDTTDEEDHKNNPWKNTSKKKEVTQATSNKQKEDDIPF